MSNLVGTSYSPNYTSGVILNDGRILRYIANFGGSGIYIWIFADINGLKGPNKVGKDIFVLETNKDSNYYPVFVGSRLQRAKLISKGIDVQSDTDTNNMGCNKSSKGIFVGWLCGALIQQDGWKIKDDYPW